LNSILKTNSKIYSFRGNKIQDEDAKFIILSDCGCIINVIDLDSWMDIKPDGGIGFKKCPKCQIVIRKSARYTPIINQTLIDIEAIKMRIINTQEDLKTKRKDLLQELEKKMKTEYSKAKIDLDLFDTLLKRLEDAKWKSLQNESRTVLQNMIIVLPALFKLEKISQLQPDAKNKITDFKQRLMILNLHVSGLQEIHFEVSAYEIFLCATQINRTVLLSKEDAKIFLNLLSCNNVETKQINEDTLNKLRADLIYLQKKYHSQLPTPEERKQIINALGSEAKKWYKCPKGHFYAIGDCGQAMQASVCPDCGSTVGGTHHTLNPTNSEAHIADILK